MATTRFAFWSDCYREFLRKLRLWSVLAVEFISLKRPDISPPSFDDIDEIDKYLKSFLGNKWIYDNADFIFNIDNTIENFGCDCIRF